MGALMGVSYPWFARVFGTRTTTFSLWAETNKFGRQFPPWGKWSDPGFACRARRLTPQVQALHVD